MSEYSLDVAFNSNTTPLNVDDPIYAVGFGFAEYASGVWKEDGQQVEIIPNGATFYFSIFDTARNTRASVSQLDISFFDPDNPHVLWPYSPLADPDSTELQNPLVASVALNSAVGNQCSPGCNVANAAVWRVGPYIVTLPEDVPSLLLDCTLQITVIVDPKNPNSTKTFSIDPEVQVEGGG